MHAHQWSVWFSSIESSSKHSVSHSFGHSQFISTLFWPFSTDVLVSSLIFLQTELEFAVLVTERLASQAVNPHPQTLSMLKWTWVHFQSILERFFFCSFFFQTINTQGCWQKQAVLNCQEVTKLNLLIKSHRTQTAKKEEFGLFVQA